MIEYVEEISFLNDLASEGVGVEMIGEWQFLVSGFFKSGQARVNLKTKEIHTRYGQVTSFSVDGLPFALMDLNLQWAQREPDYLDWDDSLFGRFWSNRSFKY